MATYSKRKNKMEREDYSELLHELKAERKARKLAERKKRSQRKCVR